MRSEKLPLDIQAKLLRVLQEGEFDPVGGAVTKKVDVRVLAATNRDLKQAVREGTFREDLFYRLNVFPLQLPPLREPGEDVVRLATLFAQRFAARMGRAIAPLNAESAQRLQRYGWPGNVRELQNVIERAVITANDGHLNLERALPEVRADASDADKVVSIPGRILWSESWRSWNGLISYEPLMQPIGKYPVRRVRRHYLESMPQHSLLA